MKFDKLLVPLDGSRIAALSTTGSFGTTSIGRVQLGENGTGKTYDVAFDDVAVDTAAFAEATE